MGLNAGAIYLSEPGVAKDVAARLGLLKPHSAPISHCTKGFDFGRGVRIGRVDGAWSVILVSPAVLLAHLENLSSVLTEQSHGRKVLLWCTQSATGKVVFEVHENGALRRKWVEEEGQVLEDVGQPVMQENGLVDRQGHESGPLHCEWTMLDLAEKMTGISVDAHFEMDGPVYATVP